MKYLICGLGNVGVEYEHTRHNIGFLTLDRLASLHQLSFASRRYADYTEMKYKGRQLFLIKPTTFMNLSGKAISFWLNTLKIPKENLLVVVDDLALPFAQLRLRTAGNAAGHNGLRNIEELLMSQQYARLRMGIGNDFPKGQQVQYVLSNFSSDEMLQLPNVMDKAIEYIFSFCTIGAERTMNHFNQKGIGST